MDQDAIVLSANLATAEDLRKGLVPNHSETTVLQIGKIHCLKKRKRLVRCLQELHLCEICHVLKLVRVFGKCWYVGSYEDVVCLWQQKTDLWSRMHTGLHSWSCKMKRLLLCVTCCLIVFWIVTSRSNVAHRF